MKTGSTQTGSFKVKNVGDPGSMLDWEIIDWPDWGTWSFNPKDGENLGEGYEVVVSATVVAPSEEDKTYKGEITIVNSNDTSDECTVQVSLITPRNRNSMFSLLLNFLERIFYRFPNAFPMIRYLLGL